MSLNRSMLIIPGNNPQRLQNAPVFNPDLLALDLADGVSIDEKDSARILVKEAINFMDYENVQVVVRINSLQSGLGAKDIEVITPVKPVAFIVSQASAEQLQNVEKVLSESEKNAGLNQGSIGLIPVIETVEALENISSVLSASPRVNGVFFNAEGLARELGINRSKEGDEILYARSKVAMACRAAGIKSFDTVFTDVNDIEGLEKDSLNARNLGFTGKAAIDGRQIDTIHKIFV
ncbi:citrate lyase beta subunit [Desulfosporosinus acidiphilus SJ4]|uniref:Citrate lyase beta subunit n=1 Tax=Desulfosporosinus acidiphilus (strain DSM 22704 / JCM 16185 / SJ4) TaxID=646529 RepID=I4D1R0_DESAJ|nr:aldolase/citrate lyase family protein [Desulfosporosinus acidiphilus]AFM39734.1 citrate lyase beta subunit [Desulfosporosinus acidiphilus SJ4]